MSAKIKIKQISSPIKREASQRKTLIGLGLNKLNRVAELQDTPEIRGMIKKVAHMIEVI
jgi:large subunit ribosomal protein L30